MKKVDSRSETNIFLMLILSRSNSCNFEIVEHFQFESLIINTFSKVWIQNQIRKIQFWKYIKLNKETSLNINTNLCIQSKKYDAHYSTRNHTDTSESKNSSSLSAISKYWLFIFTVTHIQWWFGNGTVVRTICITNVTKIINERLTRDNTIKTLFNSHNRYV